MIYIKVYINVDIKIYIISFFHCQ